MTVRFDFEQELLRCWNVTDDIKLLAEFNSKPEAYTALADLYNIKFEKVWSLFEKLVDETRRSQKENETR